MFLRREWDVTRWLSVVDHLYILVKWESEDTLVSLRILTGLIRGDTSGISYSALS